MPIDKPQIPAERLRDFMKARGLSQARLARELGYTRQHINQMVHGSERLSEACVEKLAEVYGLSRAWLLVGEGDPYGGSTTTAAGQTITVAASSGPAASPGRVGARPIILCPGCHQSLRSGVPECPSCGLRLDWPDPWEGRYR